MNSYHLQTEIHDPRWMSDLEKQVKITEQQTPNTCSSIFCPNSEKNDKFKWQNSTPKYMCRMVYFNLITLYDW